MDQIFRLLTQKGRNTSAIFKSFRHLHSWRGITGAALGKVIFWKNWRD